jgi:hypothetical protein
MASASDEDCPAHSTPSHEENIMNYKLAKLALIVAASATGATTAFAHQDYSEAQTAHWISHVSEAGGQPTATQLAPYGYASPGVAAREIKIDSGTRFLNVKQLETVRIDAGGKSTIWTFDTLGTTPFPLSKIVAGADGVTVFVDESPDHQGS